MIAYAPGKVVISGAYAVLYGAPAIVSAVDRYVRADGKAKSDFITPEVRCALGDGDAPCFDAAPLREDGRKLGLGSSAAILVASLASRYAEWTRTPEGLNRLFSRALAAHREAQGGGSGIDVLASTYGGTRLARQSGETLDHRPISLPAALHFEVWTSPRPASTASFIQQVMALEDSHGSAHSDLMTDLSQAAELAAESIQERDAEGLLAALASQHTLLVDLGRLAGIPIVTPEVRELRRQAEAEQAVVIPAGAGGGDIALYVGFAPPSRNLSRLARELDHQPISLQLNARGVHVEAI